MDNSAVILLVLLLGTLNTVQCQYEETKSEDFEGSGPIDDIPEEKYTVSALIERANKNAGRALDDPEITEGDIAVHTGFRNADPCTSRSCKWPRAQDGLVYVPYYISKDLEYGKHGILDAMELFTYSTCIRFRPLTKERDYLYFVSGNGCWTKFVGRRGGRQFVTLTPYCMSRPVIQRQLLHTLGFVNEENRSDRDQYVRINYQNVRKGQEPKFDKINTNNLGTPYDYSSVMHSRRYHLSANSEETIVPIPDPKVAIGWASKMSRIDILRVNRLYGCKQAGPWLTT